MLSFIFSVKQQGFVILTSVVLLTLACIIFTTHMASSQLVDNQIIANYYRNNEAFANAESGINFVLSQLDDPEIAQILLSTLPVIYDSTSSHYSVAVQKVNASRLAIRSDGTSVDGSAKRQVSIEVDFYLNFPIPVAALSANGKLNLADSALINNGCEGLSSNDCHAGNVAENMLISNPAIEVDGDEECSAGKVGSNVIAEEALKGDSPVKSIAKIIDEDGTERYDWGSVSISEGSEIGSLTPDLELNPSTLFEATLGAEMSEDNLDILWNNSLQIDMRNGGDCSDMLLDVGDQDTIIFIKGDCNISGFNATQSQTSENSVFTIGSVDNPKLIFIEGGTFIASTGTEASVVGMLYFLPGRYDLVDDVGNFIDLEGNPLDDFEAVIQVVEPSIELGTISVNGALLTEYQCSHDGYDTQALNVTDQHLSARFDRLVLNELYSDLGVAAIGSGYRLVPGTWRDF